MVSFASAGGWIFTDLEPEGRKGKLHTESIVSAGNIVSATSFFTFPSQHTHLLIAEECIWQVIFRTDTQTLSTCVIWVLWVKFTTLCVTGTQQHEVEFVVIRWWLYYGTGYCLYQVSINVWLGTR